MFCVGGCFVFRFPDILEIILKIFLIILYFSALDGRPQREEPEALAGCDPDFGWHDGADGSGKCYRLIKASDFS